MKTRLMLLSLALTPVSLWATGLPKGAAGAALCVPATTLFPVPEDGASPIQDAWEFYFLTGNHKLEFFGPRNLSSSSPLRTVTEAAARAAVRGVVQYTRERQTGDQAEHIETPHFEVRLFHTLQFLGPEGSKIVYEAEVRSKDSAHQVTRVEATRRGDGQWEIQPLPVMGIHPLAEGAGRPRVVVSSGQTADKGTSIVRQAKFLALHPAEGALAISMALSHALPVFTGADLVGGDFAANLETVAASLELVKTIDVTLRGTAAEAQFFEVTFQTEIPHRNRLTYFVAIKRYTPGALPEAFSIIPVPAQADLEIARRQYLPTLHPWNGSAESALERSLDFGTAADLLRRIRELAPRRT
ncbi:hypothetical protein K2X33_11455 [bacterium]|nr:hypothetical protein [bacterium]